MGSPGLFTRQQALKLGYFYWLRVENSNPLLTELSRCYLKHTKFYLEHKVCFKAVLRHLIRFGLPVVGVLHFFGQFRG